MTAFQFFAGLVLFGLLWLIFPRTSFLAVLSICLTKTYGIHLFPSQGSNAGEFEIWATILILLACILGFFMDLFEHYQALKGIDRL